MRTWLLTLSFLLLAVTVRGADRDVGAFYYPWYGADRHWPEGYLRHLLVPAQPPQLGEYDSRSSALIDQHLDWSEQYGIDHWICSWWGSGSWEDVTLRDQIAPRMTGRAVSYCLFYESAGLLGLSNGAIVFDSTRIARLRADFQFMAANHFNHPRYQRIANRPVVYLYLTRTYSGSYAQALQLVRQDMNALGHDVYLVGDEVYWGTPNSTRIAQFDAITAYNMHGPADLAGYPSNSGLFAKVSARFAQYRATAARFGVSFIPSIMPGFNDRGVRLAANHYAIPSRVHPDSIHTSTLRGFIDVAEQCLDPALPAVAVTSFNEWHEDTQIEPTVVAPSTTADQSGTNLYTQGYPYTGYGTDLLELIRQRLGQPSLADALPPSRDGGVRLDAAPNPSRQGVTIRFDLTGAAVVCVRIFDTSGRVVRTLSEGGALGAGHHELPWAGVDSGGRRVRPGVYFVKLEAASVVATRRVALVE